jgi:hypothetical protein
VRRGLDLAELLLLPPPSPHGVHGEERAASEQQQTDQDGAAGAGLRCSAPCRRSRARRDAVNEVDQRGGDAFAAVRFSASVASRPATPGWSTPSLPARKCLPTTTAYVPRRSGRCAAPRGRRRDCRLSRSPREREDRDVHRPAPAESIAARRRAWSALPIASLCGRVDVHRAGLQRRDRGVDALARARARSQRQRRRGGDGQHATRFTELDRAAPVVGRHERVAVVGGGTNVSLIVRGLTQRIRFHSEPALSFVPEARAPPNGCWPTTAPVGLSLT